MTSRLRLVSDVLLSLASEQRGLFLVQCLEARGTDHLGKKDANMGRMPLEPGLLIGLLAGWVLIQSPR